MVIRDLLALVLSNLRRIKARVAMTAIGVIIGTAAVVVLVSLGAGLQKQATESLFSMGSLDELIVRDDSYWGTVIGEDGREQERQGETDTGSETLDNSFYQSHVRGGEPGLDVENRNSQDRAVGGDQGKEDSQGAVEAGRNFLDGHFNQLHQ